MFGLPGLSVPTRNLVSRSTRLSRVTSMRPLSLESTVGPVLRRQLAVSDVAAAQVAGEFVARPVRIEFQFRRDHRVPRRRGVLRARRVGVVAAGELDRGLEVEGADLDADRIERRLLRPRTAALGWRVRERIGRDVIGRRAPARDAARGARNGEPRRRVKIGVRRSVARRRRLRLLAGLVFSFALAFGLALAGGVEAGGAGAGCQLEGGRRQRLRVLGLGAGSLEARRALRIAIELRAQQRGAALGKGAHDGAGEKRRKRPDAERECQRRKAKARHPVTPGPDRARSPRDACPARAEKCVSDQTVPPISTTPGGPPDWAVRGSRALWLTKLKRIWLTGR